MNAVEDEREPETSCKGVLTMKKESAEKTLKPRLSYSRCWDKTKGVSSRIAAER